jgi:hypothetical protein
LYKKYYNGGWEERLEGISGGEEPSEPVGEGKPLKSKNPMGVIGMK